VGLFRRRFEAAAPKIHVDILEDHALLRESLASWLEANAATVKVVGRFSSWAELAASLGQLSDVVLVDILLGDRIPLRSKIQAILSTGSQVVVCSSLATPLVIRQAFDAGALAYIPKTSGAEVLTTAVLAAARGEKFVLPELAGVFDVPGPRIRLTPREHEAVTLYLGGAGGTMADVGASLGISADGVKKLLVSVRRKAHNGPGPLSRPALRELLIADGWLLPDQ
jgi:two-component system, NarL family, uhpT operon response regulator UhpA